MIDTFGSREKFFAQFIAEAKAFKSLPGWGWLVLNTQTNNLEIKMTDDK